MANPQKENGYTAIANEIMEALARTRIPGEARQVLDVIVRKTYGYQKPTDLISLSQFVELTGLSRKCVCRAIEKLLEMRIIKKTFAQYQKRHPSGRSAAPVAKVPPVTGGSYGLNKDYEKWLPSGKSATPVANLRIPPVAKAPHTKETITKEIIPSVEINSTAAKIEKPAVKLNGWAIWVDVNRARNRADPIPNGADTKAAKMLVDHIKDIQTIKDVMGLYLDDDDNYLQRNGHALRLISGRINAYINQAENLFSVPDDDEALAVIMKIEDEVAAEEQAQREKQSGNINRPAGAN